MRKKSGLSSRILLATAAAAVAACVQSLGAATTTPFTYRVNNWSTQPSAMQYVSFSTNMSIQVEHSNGLDFWAANSSGSAALVLHFDLNAITGSADYDIERAALYVPVSLFDWSNPDPTGALSVSTDGTNWTELMRATAGVDGPTGSKYGFIYGTHSPSGVVAASLPQVVGADEIWLRIDMTDIGYPNTAQMGRSVFSDTDHPAFLLEVNVEEAPEPSASALLALASLSLALRRRR